MGSHTFNIEALLLVLPTTNYLKKVPVSINTTITDMMVDFINQNKPDDVSKSWKVVCCATHTRKLVYAQPKKKRSIKTAKPVTLPSFSTTIVKGNTKFRSHGMRLILIAESYQLYSIAIWSTMYPNILHNGDWLQQGFSRIEKSVIKVHNNSIMICCRSDTTGHNPEGTNLWKT